MQSDSSVAASQLSARLRKKTLDDVQDRQVDVLVIGGGVTGAGAALDAAARGLSVALVEARDLAAGTSSRSSKLIHGGLRYLEHLQIRLVREALRERRLLLDHVAPHIVRPVPFVYPLEHRIFERAYVGAGLAIYDALGGRGSLPRHRHLSSKRLQRIVPALADNVAIGGIEYHDAQVDDARLVITLARTAAVYGARILTGTPVTGLTRASDGRITGATVRDTASGRDLSIRARHTIAAVGAWTPQFREMAAVGAPGSASVLVTKGVHVTVPRQAIEASTGVITRTDRSVLFMIPWERHWLLGTTDTPWSYDIAHPAVSRRDIDYVLSQANRWLKEPLTRDAVISSTAGVRALVAASGTDTARVSRGHVVESPAPGLTLVLGGKLTTYRVIAAEAVDVAASTLGRVPPSSTESIPLLGAMPPPRTHAAIAALSRQWHLDAGSTRRLARRYGSVSAEIARLAEDDPALAMPLPHVGGYIRAEIVHIARNEAVLHLDDVLTRRTRIALEVPDRGASVAADVAQIIGAELGWDGHRQRQEISSYLERLAAEASAECRDDDAAAQAARSAWRDPRLSLLDG